MNYTPTGNFQEYIATTYYNVTTPKGNVPVLDNKGRIIDSVSGRGFVDASMEGSAVLPNGHQVNVDSKFITPPDPSAYADAVAAAKKYYSKKNGSPKRVGLSFTNVTAISNIDPSKDIVSQVFAFRVSHDAEGKRGKLKAYYSIAVSSKIPIGSQVFIQELQNSKLPNGTIHDGWVSADDHGGAIKGNRIDFYADERNKSFLEGLVHLYVHGQ